MLNNQTQTYNAQQFARVWLSIAREVLWYLVGNYFLYMKIKEYNVNFSKHEANVKQIS